MKPFLLSLLLLFLFFENAVAQNTGIGILGNGIDSGLVRHSKPGQVYSLRFTGDSTQALRGNGAFGRAGGKWALTGNASTGVPCGSI